MNSSMCFLSSGLSTSGCKFGCSSKFGDNRPNSKEWSLQILQLFTPLNWWVMWKQDPLSRDQDSVKLSRTNAIVILKKQIGI